MNNKCVVQWVDKDRNVIRETLIDIDDEDAVFITPRITRNFHLTEYCLNELQRKLDDMVVGFRIVKNDGMDMQNE